MLNRRFSGLTLAFAGAAVFVAPLYGVAQTKTDVVALRQFAARQAAIAKQDKERAVQLARVLGLPIKVITPDGRCKELMRFIGTIPVYYETTNLGSAETMGTDKLWPGGVSGLNLTGAGVILGEWDAGSARGTHQELTGRVLNPYGVATAEHSTHVAGTMIASGVDPNAHGMSFMGTLHSYDWNHEADMASEAADGLVVSNHSYGWFYYGGYEGTDMARDTLAFDAPHYLICQAAGNSGTAFQTLIVPAFAKDILVVGAVYKNTSGYTGPDSVVLSWFSSCGPAEDGRIKPDIVAPGVDLYSCIDTSDTSYTTMSGTSMATPSTSGNVGLMADYWRRTHSGADMLAATMKGLLIETADEAGPADGPDYQYGWGRLDAYSAAQLIQSSIGQPDQIQERVLDQGQTFTVTGVCDGSTPVRATVCWTDPPGPTKANPVDPTPDLVNDLDLRVAAGGTTYMPWVLDPNNPGSPATTGDNTLDNVERVDCTPPAGTSTDTVSHKGTLQGGSQAFSLLMSGLYFGRMTGLSVAPTAIASGETATGTITISLPASSAGSKVRLTNSNPSACLVPPSVTVPFQQTTRSFTVFARPVSTPTTSTITAKYGSTTFTSVVTINPPWLLTLTLSPNSVGGGTTSTGTVTIGETAPAGGAIVSLSSDNTAVATVNWDVVIPAGQTSATFTVNTNAVSSAKVVDIMASYPGPSLTAQLTVLPPVGVASVSLNPPMVPGGNSTTGTVTLAQPASPGGAVVQLSSDNSAASVPATVTVPVGKKTATFKVTTTAVAQQATANISAAYLGGTKSAALLISPPPPAPLNLSLSPATVQGGNSSTGTVTLATPAPAGGLTVKLSVSSKNYASVPKSVVIPAGTYSATFAVSTVRVSATTTEAVTATAGSRVATATLTITR